MKRIAVNPNRPRKRTLNFSKRSRFNWMKIQDSVSWTASSTNSDIPTVIPTSSVSYYSDYSSSRSPIFRSKSAPFSSSAFKHWGLTRGDWWLTSESWFKTPSMASWSRLSSLRTKMLSRTYSRPRTGWDLSSSSFNSRSSSTCSRCQQVSKGRSQSRCSSNSSNSRVSLRTSSCSIWMTCKTWAMLMDRLNSDNSVT